MRVLFLHGGGEDYLAQALFHGLRDRLGLGCVDVPRFDVMYRDLPAERRATLRGKGCTLYTLLNDLPELVHRRLGWADQIADYDLVVIASIWRQLDQIAHPAIRAAWHKVVFVDGEDGPAVVPYSKRLLLRPWELLGLLTRPAYFKREWCGSGTEYGGFTRWLPLRVRRNFTSLRRIRPIGFAIPAEKIVAPESALREKDFTAHIVDHELAAAASGFFTAVGSDKYVFTSEADYYADLRATRFGVTTKRAGWDCLRHYELAANGCVLCFRDLVDKPPSCAPHGLTADNCVSYRSADELLKVLRGMSAVEFTDRQAAAHQWALDHTTAAVAGRFLDSAINT